MKDKYFNYSDGVSDSNSPNVTIIDSGFLRSVLLLFFISFILSFSLTGCGDDNNSSSNFGAVKNSKEKKLNIVTTFTIIEDITRNIAKDKVNIINIVGYDSDPHVYNPTPEVTKKLCSADLVIQNGLGFEGWISRLVKSSCYIGKVITASDGIKVSYMDCDCKNHVTSPIDRGIIGDGNTKQFIDPHAWGDVRNVIIYATNIKNALIELDPSNKDFYERNYLRYKKQLEDLDNWIVEKFKKAKCGGIKVITAHDAFFYFGKRYGIEFIALQGISTESTPSAKDIAQVINTIRDYHISAIFAENISNSKLISQVARESNVKIGGELYSDSLSKNKNADSYIKMMRYNVNLIASTLCL